MFEGESNPRSRETARLGKPLTAVLLAFGALCVAFLVVGLAPRATLWVLGQRVKAEVMDVWAEPIGDAEDGVLDFRYFVTYRFVTARGQVITKTSEVSLAEWANLQEGGPLTVVYFPPYPNHNQLDESRYALLLACSYLPLGLIGGMALIAGWRRIRP